MSAIIPGLIDPQAYEVVRDRVGRILAEELENQYVLSGNDREFKVSSWIERMVPFDKTELSAVNVCLAEGSFDGDTVIQSDGTYRYYVDVYVNAKSKNDEDGDVRAMYKLHRILGLCRAIIKDARYKTLGFAPGFIMRRQWENIQIENPKHKEHDSLSTVMGRLVLSVKVPEITTYVQPVNLLTFITTVKLAQTERGYKWIRGGSMYDVWDYSFDSSFGN